MQFLHGATLDDATVTAMIGRLTSLDSEARQWAVTMLQQAKDAGVPISVRQWPTMRHFELSRALIAWSGFADDDLARCGITYAAGPDPGLFDGVPIGALIGTLSVDDAVRFAELPDLIAAGTLVYIADAQGERIEPTVN